VALKIVLELSTAAVTPYDRQLEETMKVRFIFLSVFLNSAVAVGQTQSVHVKSGDAKIIAKSSTILHAVCPEAVYDLDIDRRAKRLNFSVTLPSARSPSTWDLAASDFGNDILGRRLFGSYAVVCGRDAAVVHFQGLEVHADSSVIPVSYILTLRNDGGGDFGGGVRQEQADFLTYALYR
jgi:hypothetical protein